MLTYRNPPHKDKHAETHTRGKGATLPLTPS